MAKLWIGTSGFFYPDWLGNFYPEDIASDHWLEHYAKHFKTVELNNSFYRLPQVKTLSNWYQKVPDDFLFSVKANQAITHFRKLKVVQEKWQPFFSRTILLKEKLGAILFQLPPNFKKNALRLEEFLKTFKSSARFAFEFRDKSWFDEEVFEILKAFNCSLVLHDSLELACPPLATTADFVYLRLHGVETLYNYEYSLDQLRKWANKIKSWLRQDRDVFCYFNNDIDAFAVKNAKELLELLT